MAEEQLKHDALEYHEFPTAGKISIAPTNTLRTSATCRSRTPRRSRRSNPGRTRRP